MHRFDRRGCRVLAAILLALVAALESPRCASAGGDPVQKCRAAIVAGAGKLARARLASLRKCEDAKRAGKLPALGACRDEPAVAAAFATARAKLTAAVTRACGGADRSCGGGDDVALATIGWPAVCPELEGSGCAAPLASCADVPACVACLADAALDRGIALAYEPFAAVDARTAKTIGRCQKALGAAAAALAGARAAADAKCLGARIAGKHAAACPVPGDGSAAGTLAKVRAKADASVCKACGGADGRCGGADDLARDLVGLAAACPGVGACDTTITGVADAVECFACTSAARIDCALAGAAAGIVDYPAGCAAVPATPTPTTTPSPTLTPSASPTLSPTPTPTATPVFCPRAASGGSQVTLGVVTGGASLGGASLVLAYDPARVRLDGIGDAAAVRAAVTDLTAGALLNKGAPNNQDHDGDGEPDRMRFTLIAPNGVAGNVLRVAFGLCDGSAAPVAADYVCTVLPGTAVATDGVTKLPNAACALTIENTP